MNDVKFTPIPPNQPGANGSGYSSVTHPQSGSAANSSSSSAGAAPQGVVTSISAAGASASQLAGTDSSHQASSYKKEEKNVQAAVKNLNDYVQAHRRELKFSIDKGTGQTVIDVVDQSSGKVVKQIPEELVLKLAQELQQNEPLSLFKAKV